MLAIGLSKALLNVTRTGASLHKLTQIHEICSLIRTRQPPISLRLKNVTSPRLTSLFLSEQNWKILGAGLFYKYYIAYVLLSEKGKITYVAYDSPSTLASIWTFGTNDDKVNI